MTDQRGRKTHHIRAAQRWLGKAESSLEDRNDIQGDLKLMLARAELSRVEEAPRTARLKRWVRRLLPAAAALVIAGAFLLPLPQAGEAVPESASAVPRQESVDRVSAPAQTEPAATSVTSEPAVLPEKNPVPVTRAEESSALPKTAEPAPASAESAASVPQQTPVQTARVPSADKQKLMQSAGKALRE